VADTITLTPDTGQAGVLVHVHVDSTAGTGDQVTVTLERSSDGGTTWVRLGNAVAVPVVGTTADQGDVYVWDHGAPLNTAVMYRATTAPTVATVVSTPATITADTDGWLKDPARPWANLELDLCPSLAECITEDEPAVALVYDGLGTETWAADATLIPVLNRRRPGDVYALRKDATTSARFVSRTLPSAFALNTLWAWGGPLFLQLPPEYGWCDRYYQPGDIDETRLTGTLNKPYRLWDAPLTVVDQPVGPTQGTASTNWCAVAEAYPTWADLAASGFTWGQVAEGAAAPIRPIPAGGYGGGGYGDGPYGG
jgi:hypothetical protein